MRPREPWRCKDFIQARPRSRVRPEDAGDEVFGGRARVHVVWEAVLIVAYSPIGGLHILRLKWRASKQHRIQYHPERPHVNFERVPMLPLEDLGSNIIGVDSFSTRASQDACEAECCKKTKKKLLISQI